MQESKENRPHNDFFLKKKQLKLKTKHTLSELRYICHISQSILKLTCENERL